MRCNHKWIRTFPDLEILFCDGCNKAKTYSHLANKVYYFRFPEIIPYKKRTPTEKEMKNFNDTISYKRKR